MNSIVYYPLSHAKCDPKLTVGSDGLGSGVFAIIVFLVIAIFAYARRDDFSNSAFIFDRILLHLNHLVCAKRGNKVKMLGPLASLGIAHFVPISIIAIACQFNNK